MRSLRSYVPLRRHVSSAFAHLESETGERLRVIGPRRGTPAATM